MAEVFTELIQSLTSVLLRLHLVYQLWWQLVGPPVCFACNPGQLQIVTMVLGQPTVYDPESKGCNSPYQFPQPAAYNAEVLDYSNTFLKARGQKGAPVPRCGLTTHPCHLSLRSYNSDTGQYIQKKLSHHIDTPILCPSTYSSEAALQPLKNSTSKYPCGIEKCYPYCTGSETGLQQLLILESLWGSLLF